MEELIKIFLSKSDGYGYGSGSGHGSGFDYGFCISSGFDDTCFDDGFGDGSGCGSGYGSCDGSGYGYLLDNGIKKYEEQTVYIVDGIQTLIYSVHGNYAKGAIVNSDLTLSPCFIAKEYDYFAHGEKLQDAVTAAHLKAIQNLTEEERIDKFLQEYPNKNKKHSGREFFNWHHFLTGSCEMGRKQFCKDNNIDIDAEYTPMEFLNICKDAYGGDIIKQVIKQYN